MSSVLLGVCEESISSKVVTSWKDNKVGGKPDWYQSGLSNPKCNLCGKKSQFVCQLYCPLTNSSYHRTLYVFACCRKLCKNKDGSWIVLRCQSLSKQESSVSLPKNSEDDFWGVDDASWSDDDEDDVTNGSKNSEISKCQFSICSTADESSIMKETQDTKELPDQYFGRTVDSESEESKTEEQNCQNSDDEAVVELSQLSVMDVDNKESGITDETGASVVAEEALFNADGSILSKLVACSNFSIENVSATAENDFADIIFSSFYVNAYNEEDFTVDMKHCLALERKYLQQDSELRSFLHEFNEPTSSNQKSSKGATKTINEKYGVNEYDKKPVHFDRAIWKFTEKLKLCPQQVLRYCYSGVPLHFREQNAKRIVPLCDCGSPRIFEMQLMPGMVDYLRLPESSENVLEFGSAYVYTCASSCWTETTKDPRHEFIFCEEYSDLNLFRKDC